jgi:hypothetical protein
MFLDVGDYINLMKEWVKNLRSQGISIERRAQILDTPTNVIRRLYAGDEDALNLVLEGRASRSGIKMFHPALSGPSHVINPRHPRNLSEARAYAKEWGHPIPTTSKPASTLRGWWQNYLARAGILSPAEAAHLLGADRDTARRWFDKRLDPSVEIRIKRPVFDKLVALVEKNNALVR